MDTTTTHGSWRILVCIFMLSTVHTSYSMQANNSSPPPQRPPSDARHSSRISPVSDTPHSSRISTVSSAEVTQAFETLLTPHSSAISSSSQVTGPLHHDNGYDDNSLEKQGDDLLGAHTSFMHSFVSHDPGDRTLSIPTIRPSGSTWDQQLTTIYALLSELAGAHEIRSMATGIILANITNLQAEHTEQFTQHHQQLQNHHATVGSSQNHIVQKLSRFLSCCGCFSFCKPSTSVSDEFPKYTPLANLHFNSRTMSECDSERLGTPLTAESPQVLTQALAGNPLVTPRPNELANYDLQKETESARELKEQLEKRNAQKLRESRSKETLEEPAIPSAGTASNLYAATAGSNS